MKTVAIMCSGGLDSYIMYHYAKKNGFKPLPIRVDIGQPYKNKELEAIREFEFYDEIIQINLSDFVSKIPTAVDKHNQIIPGRNLLLWIIWANFGEEVRLGALHSEWHGKERDKSYKFFEDSTHLLTYLFNIIRERTEIKTPFFHLTKTDLIARALNNWLTEDQLTRTTTCYDSNIRNCGSCSTCFKRRVAMSNNNIDEKYISNPWESEYAKEIVAEIQEWNKQGRLTDSRISETYTALARKNLYI